jgi:transposase
VLAWRGCNLSSPAEESVLPDHASYRRPVVAHLGLVAGMFDALGLGDGSDRATPQHPALRDLTLGEAGNAMGRNGLGCRHHALDLVPRLCQNNPTDRLMAPRRAPAQLTDAARGRALETLYPSGVTERSSLMAATAAERLGLAPRVAHLDRTRVHVDGRDNRDEAPEAQVVPMTRGDRRDQRPDVNQVIVARIVAPQAGLPLRLQPRSGHSRAAPAVGQAVRTPVQPWHTPDGRTSLVAESAR